MKGFSIGVVLLIASSSAWAQTAKPAPAGVQDQAKARASISIMEGVLERAVRTGADNLNRRVRDVAQDTLMIVGAPEVRGFRLDGYGVFFDVEVPMLRQSVAWSLRAMLSQSGIPIGTALDQIRTLVQSVTDVRARQSLEQALRRIELQVGPTPGLAATRSATAAGGPAAPALSAAALEWLNDPNGTYTTEVKEALVDAMLEYSGNLGLAPDEWLTIAARDNEPSDRLNPGDDSGSIILRIKGAALAALHSGTITAQDARKQVEIREY